MSKIVGQDMVKLALLLAAGELILFVVAQLLYIIGNPVKYRNELF